MPPEPLPWDRKEVFRKRKHERWRDSSRDLNRWGSPDFRRQIGHGKQGNWDFFPEESVHSHGYGSSRYAEKVVEDEGCRPISRGEMRYGRNRRDNRGPYNHREWRDHSWDGRNGFSNIPGRVHEVNNEQKCWDDIPCHSNGNTWDLREQHEKMSGRYDEWKPIKWTRSSSRGSGYGHMSSSKSVETKMVQSAAGYATSAALEDATSRKKARLGWGEGLAKYEKKKDVADFGISNSLSPRMVTFSDCASPLSSLACTTMPGHGKQGNWDFFPEESVHSHGYGSSRYAEKVVEDEGCRPISRGEMRYGRNRRDNKGPYNHREWRDHSWDGRNGFSNILGRMHEVNNEQKCRDDIPCHSNGNTWDLREQHEKMSGRYDEWKPIKWTRSSSRGSGYGHMSSSKSVETKMASSLQSASGYGHLSSSKSVETKMASPLQSASGDANSAALEDATSLKKARLGWGEGLAKYEKKKDVADCSGEPLHSLSPRMVTLSDCASPATPSSSLACITMPGLEEKSLEKVENVDNDASNLYGSPSPTPENRFTFNLEKWDLNSSANLGEALYELLQSDERNLKDSSFVRGTTMNKLLVWKADVSKALEVTDLEINQLETELKLLNSIWEGAGSSLSRDNEEDDIQNPCSESDDAVVSEEVCANPGNLASEFGGALSLASEEVVDTSSAVVLYGAASLDAIMLSNKDSAKAAQDVFAKILPPGEFKLDMAAVCNACQNAQVEDKFVQRKRFLKFKERVITLKFKVYQHLWKEDMRLLSIRKLRAKSQKKIELSLRSVHIGCQKHRSSIRSRFSSPAGNLNLVPTTEVIKLTRKLLGDSQVRLYRKTLKMPALILDKRENVTSRFISDNGLVEDPRAIEKGRVVINPWTPEEIRLFMDKLAIFGKNFKRIASCLDHKTTGDCVEFYYKNHKSDWFEKKKKLDSGGNQVKSLSSGNYLMTLGGKKWNRELNAASLDILGEASVMVANADSNNRQTNERETAAADVLAGICSSVSSEALSSIDPTGPEWKETCSDDSCGDTDSTTDWTDAEKSMFIEAVSSYGRDFDKISERVRTRSREECKVFFSKARKCLGLDRMHAPAGDKLKLKGETVNSQSELSSWEGKDGELVDLKENIGPEAWVRPNVASDGDSNIVNGGVDDQSEVVPVNESESALVTASASSSGSQVVVPDSSSAADRGFSNYLDLNLPHPNSGVEDKMSSSSCSQVAYSETNPFSLQGCYLHKCNSSMPEFPLLSRRAHSLGLSDSEKSSRSSGGDVKLFGKILSNNPLNVEEMRSFRYWDGKLSPVPDSTLLLAKYPAAFTDPVAALKLHFDQAKANGS